MHKSQIDSLNRLLDEPLPGWLSHNKLSPVDSRRYRKKNNNSKEAAVLALLYPNIHDHLDLVFIKRPSNNPHDKHGGQISFPGGRIEQSDQHPEDTALRETMEEIGVHKDQVRILGSLTPIYVFVSDFYVEPYVGYLPEKPEFQLQEDEVDYVITEPVNNLLLPGALKTKDILVRNNKIPNVPFYEIQGEALWGATAMITSELLDVIRKI